MATKNAQLVIIIPLTVLDGFIGMYYGGSVWTARSCEIWARSLSVVSAMLELISRASVCVQAVSNVGRPFGLLDPARDPTIAPIPIESRGGCHV